MNNDLNTKKKLGLMSCITILVGGMFGSAIFSLSGQTIVYAGPSSIISWLVAGIILLLYGLMIAELASIYPKTGGVYIFPSKTIGKNKLSKEIIGWISSWGYMNSCLVGIVFAAIYVSTYLGVAFPVLGNYQIILAIIACLFCGILNIFNISTAGKVNLFLVCALLISSFIYITIGLFNFTPSNFIPFFTQGKFGISGIFMSIPIAMVAFGSIVAVAMMASDVREPQKNIPKSMIISITIILIIYLLIIFTTLGLVPTNFLINNPGMQFIPLYAASWTALSNYTFLPYVISISAVLALITTMLVLIAITSRTMSTIAENNLLPKFISKRNFKTLVPVNATIVVTLICIIISCFPQFIEQLVNAGGLFAAITIIINIISLLFARKQENYKKEVTFKAFGGSLLPVLMIIIIIACYIPSIIDGLSFWYLTLGWYLIGLIIFLVMYRKKIKIKE